MPHPRKILFALLPFALHGFAREVDAAMGLLLKASTPPSSFVAEALRVLASFGAGAAGRVALWTAAGALVWLLLAAVRAREEGRGLSAALGREAASFEPLYLRPLVSLLALASLALDPSFPYAFTLPVALSQDWGEGQDVAALCAFAAIRLPAFRLPAPRAGAVFLVSFLAYALLTPEWARQWEGHPGNEPKYLRMAVAIGHELTLDAEGVSAPMEELQPRPLLQAAGRATEALVHESLDMFGALAGGAGIGRESITASRITRQTIRGKEGGVFYVLAPGPSFLLAPALRVDRALNRARGIEGRVAVSVLLWNAMAAALVAALFVLVRDATERPGLAALLAFGFAVAPPFLFYGYQFYPEMPGALVMALAAHRLTVRLRSRVAGAWATGALLAALPWMHQKFLPVWIVLVAVAIVVAVREKAPLTVLVGLVAPQAATLYLTALYNFAIAGSVRPDALFLAWGPGGVSSARIGQGLVGLLLDARYGILPFAPVYLIAAAGLVLGGARRFALVLPAAVVYYATVASADNWSGAVCNLGRYVMPLAPLAAALVGMALARTSSRRGVMAVVLILSGWTGLLARRLYQDPHAANDGSVLLARSTFADGNQYVPNLFIRSWSDGAPGLGARIVVWLALALALAFWMRRAAGGKGGESPVRALCGVAALVLATGLLLERWPSARMAPSFGASLEAAPGVNAFFDGPVAVREDEARLRRGDVDLLVRSASPMSSIRMVVGGDGRLGLPGRASIVARPAGALVDLPLEPRYTLRETGETFQGLAVRVEGDVILRVPPR